VKGAIAVPSHKDDHGLQDIKMTVNKIAQQMERTQIADYIDLLNSPGKLISRNLLAGVARGVGLAIGLTLFTVVILYILRMLGALNLPIIGDFIADLIRIVESDLNGGTY
jgi:tetrahydromethanopterin S-methyltransferase subunit F